MTELLPFVLKDEIVYAGKRDDVCVVFKPIIYFEILHLEEIVNIFLAETSKIFKHLVLFSSESLDGCQESV